MIETHDVSDAAKALHPSLEINIRRSGDEAFEVTDAATGKPVSSEWSVLKAKAAEVGAGRNTRRLLGEADIEFRMTRPQEDIVAIRQHLDMEVSQIEIERREAKIARRKAVLGT